MPRLAKILEFKDDAGDVIAVRFPPGGDGEIEWGSQLIVREGQVALFFRDGKAMAKFDPGRYLLTTQNVPVLTKFITGLAYGSGNTPFRAEVYFVASQLLRDLRWGTPEPVYLPDPVLMQIPIRANGRYAVRVSDPALFVPKVLGTQGLFRKADIEDYLRGQYIVPALTDAIASLGKSFVELPRYYRELGIGVKSLLQAEVGTLGLELVELSVGSISTTEEIQQTLNRNAQIASEGMARGKATQYDLEAKAAGASALQNAGTNYQQVGMTDAMKSMASTPGGEGGGGGAMQTGVNLGLAMMMPQMMQGMLQGQPAGVAEVKGGAKVDPVAKLKQLKELLDLGAITKEEFEAKKAELLKQI